MAANRSKRDTVENLYKSCRMGGDCPPDVVNKVEQKTLADILLQAFSSVLYLGGLGFGTGKGSTGTVGVRPLPEVPVIRPSTETVTEEIPLVTLQPKTPVRVGQGRRPFSVPLDPIGAGFRPTDPSGSRTVDVIDPGSPAVITPRESLPDTIVTIGEPNLETGDSIINNLDIITDTTSIVSHPTVIQGIEENVAILSVTPSDPPPTRVRFALPQQDPSLSIESVAGHVDPSYDVFVDPVASGEDVYFGEEIPLEPINPRLEFEIEELPQASTPEERIRRAFNRARQFYSRHVEQVRTRNLNLLGDVARAIEFGFENPAFDSEITLEFEREVNDLRSAPDIDFRDIESISKPYMQSTPEGTVRVSRLGKRAGMRTRSGTILKQNVHFFYDISPIPTAENIELSVLQQPRTVDFSVNPNVESVFINDLEELPDEELVDNYTEDFNDVHLLINATEEEGETVQMPAISTNTLKVFIHDYGSDIIVAEHDISDSPFSVPKIPTTPIQPSLDVNIYSDDFYLHPDLQKKKKRKRLDYF
uniref:Minor capsid protein L2 n=1 Tax=Human papillomavirus TaxID=10566 RepID=A0A385PIB3_9PAPI|nr:MAG: L2 protein [Human papillomavirus]